MAFKLKTSLVSTTPSVEYIEGTVGEVFYYGEALTILDEKLTKCEPTDKPKFISLGDIVCEESKTLVPVMRIFEFYLFTCPVAVDLSSVPVGKSVTLNLDATGITAETSGGVAFIVSVDDEEATIFFK